MGQFVRVGKASEICPGQRRSFWVEGIRVLVFSIEGKLYAVDASCPHRECSLDTSRLTGKVIVCPCHSAEFDVETGEVLVQPVGSPPTVPIPVHQVKAEGDDILIALSTDFDSI